MFYTDMHQPAPVLEFYRALRSNLGGGILADHKFSSFNEENKVKALSQGYFSSSDDELMHLWNHENFNFTLNYRVDPLKQFLFIVTFSPEKKPDTAPRINGTILSVLNHNIPHLLAQKAVKEQVTKESGVVKFIDYTFALDPPEFGTFEEVRIRVFSEVKQIDQDIQTHVTYYSKYEIDTSKIIILCDNLAHVYGKDNYGDKEIMPHELDMLDGSELWTGRSWLFNTSHAIQDLSDKTQSTLYGVTITLTPDDGLCLHILAFNKMMDYHNLMQL